MDNRRRWFTSDPTTWTIYGKAKHARNIARNLPFQGGNASITKRALVYITKNVVEAHPEWDAKIILTVHDEIEVEVKEQYANECAQEVKKQMILAGEYYIKKVPVVVSLDIGDHWIH